MTYPGQFEDFGGEILEHGCHVDCGCTCQRRECQLCCDRRDSRGRPSRPTHLSRRRASCAACCS